MPTDLPLHPDVRSLYGGSLRPPPGTVFDAGVATTFSLDIETALAVPVTLALFASEDRDELLKSPLALLEGLERTADRLAIFCEAGRIQAQPAPQSRLCTLLERLITEVAAPRGGSFHPKVWVLRYRPLVADEPTRIRLLRFTELLHGDHDAALLARDLFDYTDREGNAARTLLLSATPYRMLTLSGDTEDDGDHYREFLETFRFLFGHERGQELAEELSREVDRFRRAMLFLPNSKDTAREYKRSIEERLRAVIARTERVASTRDRDSMVEEPNLAVGVAPEDLRSAAAVAGVARVMDAPEVVEYWKSAPYLLNFMRDFALKRAIRSYDGTECPAPLLDAIKAARRSSLTRKHVREYRPLKPPNGRMRLLMDDVFGGGLDQHLWIPPSLPYYRDSDTDERPTSKSLVLSSWSMVPDAVAAVLSYEAERRMGVKQAGMGYFDRQRPRPLQFRVAQSRLAGLRALLLVYPSPLIAQAADPLDVVACHSETLSYDAMRAALATRLEPYVRRLQSAAGESTELDTWQWAGPAVLDALAGNRSRTWLEDANDGFVCLGAEDAWGDHVDALRKAVRARRIGGTVPDSALDLLIDRTGRARLPSLLPSALSLEPAAQSRRPGTTRRTRASLQGSCDSPT